MALGDSYGTLTELKGRLGIGASDTTDDSRLTTALATASRGIEKSCNRQFNDAVTTSARVFYPMSWTLCEIDDFSTTTGLIIQTDEADDGQYEATWETSDFQLFPLNGIVDGETGWPYWQLCSTESRYFPMRSYHAPVRITARWGWTAVPAPIKEACLIVAEETFKLKDAPFGVAGYGEYGPIRVRNNPMAWNMVAPYRRHAVLVG